jgi:gas vesicle protein
MFTGTSKTKAGLTGLLIGGAVGSALAFLFAPKSGKELRGDIKKDFDNYLEKAKEQKNKIFSDAKSIADDVLKKAEKLRDLNKKYFAGTFEGSISKIEKEIVSLRTALYTAINKYKERNDREPATEKIVDDIYIEFEEEDYPKHEGMGRRKV